MKLFVALVLCASAAAAPSREGEELFTSWKHKYSRTYATMEEHLKRLEVFLLNKVKVEEHNSNPHHGWTLGLNEFADLTEEEFSVRFGLLGGSMEHSSGKHTMSVEAPPASMDWRDHKAVNEVKNQGSCGSCWAFSTVVSLEGQQAIKSGKLESLSEQNLVDCVKGITMNGTSQTCCDGCQGGLMDSAFQYIVGKQAGHDDTETSYPYTGANGKCKYSASNSGVTITGYKDIPHADEDALKDAVANVGPISVGVDANMQWQLYHGGVMNPWPLFGCSSSPAKMDHGVAVVGYGTDSGKDYWIVRNSWGATWGEEGYMRLAMGKNACGVANSAAYPTLE